MRAIRPGVIGYIATCLLMSVSAAVSLPVYTTVLFLVFSVEPGMTVVELQAVSRVSNDRQIKLGFCIIAFILRESLIGLGCRLKKVSDGLFVLLPNQIADFVFRVEACRGFQ